MKIVSFATALAVSLACPMYAHSETTMNTENEMFAKCDISDEVTVCELKREYMACEPADKYDGSWQTFVDQNGLPDPFYSGQIVHPDHGPVTYILIRMDEHYGHTYVYLAAEGVVCLGAIAHFDGGEPA